MVSLVDTNTRLLAKAAHGDWQMLHPLRLVLYRGRSRRYSVQLDSCTLYNWESLSYLDQGSVFSSGIYSPLSLLFVSGPPRLCS